MSPNPTDPQALYWIQPLAPGIVALAARAEGTALSNSGLVDLGGSILLFDSSLSLRSARALGAIAGRELGGTPTVIVNSHWHLDHLLGNQLFEGSRIYATRRTIEILLERRAELQAEISPETLRKEVAELREKLASAPNEYARAQYAPALRLHEALLEESVDLRIVPPREGFDRELRLDGRRRATLHSFGSGHTESDAVLFLPEERVLFAGDLVVVGHHPNLLSGDPEHWGTVLREIERLRPERIVPGHGPIGSLEDVRVMQEYLATLLDLAREGPTPNIPEQFARWEGPEQFVRNLEFLRSRIPPRR